MKRVCFSLLSIAVASDPLNFCDGEFSLCDDGSCALVNSSCGVCSPNHYACPFSRDCFESIEDYASCPELKGTHLDWTLSEDERLEKLIVSVSTDEMIHQLVNDAPAIEHAFIPAYNYLNDDMHANVGTADTTVYPMGVGLGASFNTDLIYEVGAAMGAAQRSIHNTLRNKSGDGCGTTSTGEVVSNGCGITVYAPNINIVRDPRWGRAEEAYGEDPHLTSELAVAMVTGLQGNEEGSRRAPDGGALMTSAGIKHLGVYNIENNREYIDINVTARDLWETYLPAFKAAVVRGRASSLMCSYNAVNGKPTCAHSGLLNEILRKQWGFDGFVVSDYDAWKNLVDTHHYATDYEDAAAKGLIGGMDQEGGFGVYSVIDAMGKAVSDGKVSADAVKQAFRRTMLVRMRLGMFDPPSMVKPMGQEFRPELKSQTDYTLELARRAARESFVLLKNKGDVLPLAKEDFLGHPSSLALVGPQADDWRILMGAANYAPADGPSKGIVTILKGLQRAINANNVSALSIEMGCKNVSCQEVDTDAATKITAKARATIVILGDYFGSRPGWPLCHGSYGPSGTTDGCEAEALDRSTIELPGKQVELVRAMRAASEAPLLCLLIHGGAVALGDAADACDAILDLWVPGQMAGVALTDILFGDVSPAARSPITFYQATKDLPPMRTFTEYPFEGSNGYTYRHFIGPPPAFRFGFGLSYTKFEYGKLQAPATVDACEMIRLVVQVSNVGKRVSDEVVQVFASVPNATVPAPITRLVAFKRVKEIAPGTSIRVELTVTPESHAVVYDSSSVYVPNLQVEAGLLELSVGGSQAIDGASLSASVAIARTKPLVACDAKVAGMTIFV